MTDRDGDDSYRRVLTSTIVTGGATIIVAVISLFRSKLLALMVGPAGIGAMGILNSAMTLLAGIACLGLTFSGVRQIAVTTGAAQRRVRHLIWGICLASSLLAAVIVMAADRQLLDWIAGVNALSGAQWWVAAGLVAMVVAAVQMTVLQGLRQIRRLAELRIIGALIGALAGVAAVWQFGDAAIPFAVIAVPIGNIVAGIVRRPQIEVSNNVTPSSSGDLKSLLALGLVTLLTATATNSWQLGVRSLIVQHLSINDAGLYQAAFALSAMNVGLILSALSADYFPRLSKSIEDRDKVQRIVSQQFRATVTLAAPLLLGLLGFAPVALSILYSDKFVPGATLLQWQVIGDVLKLPGWVLGFILVAAERKTSFLFVEMIFSGVILLFSWLLIPSFGIQGAGIAYCIAYVFYLGTLLALTRESGGLIGARQWLHFALLLVVAIGVMAAWAMDSRIGLLLGALAFTITSVISFFHFLRHGLSSKADSAKVADETTP